MRFTWKQAIKKTHKWLVILTISLFFRTPEEKTNWVDIDYWVDSSRSHFKISWCFHFLCLTVLLNFPANFFESKLHWNWIPCLDFQGTTKHSMTSFLSNKNNSVQNRMQSLQFYLTSLCLHVETKPIRMNEWYAPVTAIGASTETQLNKRQILLTSIPCRCLYYWEVFTKQGKFSDIYDLCFSSFTLNINLSL